MDKQQLEEFVCYYCEYHDRNYRYIENIHKNPNLNIIDHMYEKFGREFIFDLPVRTRNWEGIAQNTVIDLYNITWYYDTRLILHSLTGPASNSNGKDKHYWILDCCLLLDDWLPRSALSPEEQIIYKLKHG